MDELKKAQEELKKIIEDASDSEEMKVKLNELIIDDKHLVKELLSAIGIIQMHDGCKNAEQFCSSVDKSVPAPMIMSWVIELNVLNSIQNDLEKDFEKYGEQNIPQDDIEKGMRCISLSYIKRKALLLIADAYQKKNNGETEVLNGIDFSKLDIN